jgi:hypothetical protein
VLLLKKKTSLKMRKMMLSLRRKAKNVSFYYNEKLHIDKRSDFTIPLN